MEAVGKAKWKVKWSTGPHSGTVTEQSSMSLTFWTALEASPSENEEEEEEEEAVELDGVPSDVEDVDEGTEVYAQKKARFEKFRDKLVNKEVKVNAYCNNHP